MHKSKTTSDVKKILQVNEIEQITSKQMNNKYLKHQRFATSD